MLWFCLSAYLSHSFRWPGSSVCCFRISRAFVQFKLKFWIKKRPTSLSSWYCWNIFYSLQTLTFTKNQLQNWPMRGTRCKSGHAHTRVTQKQYHTCKRNFRVFGRRDLFPHSFPIPPHTSSRVYSSSIIGLCDREWTWACFEILLELPYEHPCPCHWSVGWFVGFFFGWMVDLSKFSKQAREVTLPSLLSEHVFPIEWQPIKLWIKGTVNHVNRKPKKPKNKIKKVYICDLQTNQYRNHEWVKDRLQ